MDRLEALLPGVDAAAVLCEEPGVLALPEGEVAHRLSVLRRLLPDISLTKLVLYLPLLLLNGALTEPGGDVAKQLARPPGPNGEGIFQYFAPHWLLAEDEAEPLRLLLMLTPYLIRCGSQRGQGKRMWYCVQYRINQ